MLRSLFAVLVLSSVAAGQGFNPDRKIDGHVGYNLGRIADLPTGAEKLKLWVVLSPNWRTNAHEYAIAEAFTGGPGGLPVEPRLRAIRAGCEWNYYTSDSALFRESGLMRAVGTATPIVVLSAPDGDVSRGALLNAATCPKNARELADLLTIAVEQLNPRPQFDGQATTQLVTESGEAPCPDCVPVPSQPSLEPFEGEVPSVVPSRLTPLNVSLAATALIVFLVGAGGYLYWQKQDQIVTNYPF